MMSKLLKEKILLLTSVDIDNLSLMQDLYGPANPTGTMFEQAGLKVMVGLVVLMVLTIIIGVTVAITKPFKRKKKDETAD